MIPSIQESAEAIRSAKEALDNYKRFFFGNAKLESELYDLGFLTAEERFMAIDIALQEVTPADRRGPNPPNHITSYGALKGERLVAFRWNSPEFKREMYFKFAVVGRCGKPRLVVYSFHEHRPLKFAGESSDKEF
jgi:hypothetical protein